MPILHYIYYAKYGSGLLRVSTSYAYQGVNGKQTLHPRIPRRPRQPVSLQVPHAQTATADSEDSMGCMPHRSRDRGRAVQGRQCTIPVATRWHVLPIPVHVGERQAPETYRFRCNQGQKGSVMHRFRGYRGKLDAKKYQVPPRFPGLRGCTRPIVNSWVKFFSVGYGGGGTLLGMSLQLTCVVVGCQAKSTCGHSTGGIYFWSVSASSGLHPISGMSSKIDTRLFHGGRIDLEGGYTLRVGSYSGPAAVARSRVGPSIKFGHNARERLSRIWR